MYEKLDRAAENNSVDAQKAFDGLQKEQAVATFSSISLTAQSSRHEKKNVVPKEWDGAKG